MSVSFRKITFVLSIVGITFFASLFMFSSAEAGLSCPPAGTESHIEGCCYTGESAVSTVGQEGCIINACSGSACPSENIPIVTRTINTTESNTFKPGAVYFDTEKEIGFIESIDDGEADIQVNVVLQENSKGASTAIGRFIDSFFLMMRDFYRGLFGGSKVSQEEEFVNQDQELGINPSVAAYYCDGPIVNGYCQGNIWNELDCANHQDDCENWTPISSVAPDEGGDVPEVASPDEADRKSNLYCEVDFSLSDAEQKVQIRECVNKSDLSDAEKESVIKSVNQ